MTINMGSFGKFGFVTKIAAKAQASAELDVLQQKAADLELAVRREKALRPTAPMERKLRSADEELVARDPLPTAADFAKLAVDESRVYVMTRKVGDVAVVSVTGTPDATAAVASSMAVDAARVRPAPEKRNLRTKAGRQARDNEIAGVRALLQAALAAGTGVHCFSSPSGDGYSAHVKAAGAGWESYIGYDNGQLSIADKDALDAAVRKAFPGVSIWYNAD